MDNVLSPMNINKNLISSFIDRCKKVIAPEYKILCINNYIYLVTPDGDYMPTWFTSFHFIGMMEIHKDDPHLGKTSAIVLKIISAAKHNFSIMSQHVSQLNRDINRMEGHIDRQRKRLIFKENILHIDDGTRLVPLMNDCEFKDCYTIFTRDNLAKYLIKMYKNNIHRFRLNDSPAM